MRSPLLAAVMCAATLLVPQSGTQDKAEPKVGEAAPLIRLNDHEGDIATVGGESDRWTVLAFYPKALTPG